MLALQTRSVDPLHPLLARALLPPILGAPFLPFRVKDVLIQRVKDVMIPNTSLHPGLHAFARSRGLPKKSKVQTPSQGTTVPWEGVMQLGDLAVRGRRAKNALCPRLCSVTPSASKDRSALSSSSNLLTAVLIPRR